MSTYQYTRTTHKCKHQFSHKNFFIWPGGVSYLAWKKFLKNFPKSKKTKPHKVKIKLNNLKIRFQKSKQNDQNFQKQTLATINTLEKNQNKKNSELDALDKSQDEPEKLELITILKKFWDRKKISQHIEEVIPDYRNQDLITYSKQSIIMSALTIFLFRIGSGNKYGDKFHDEDEKYSKRNISIFINSPEDRVPVIKTIENFLKNLGEDCVNDLMISFFKDLIASKFFNQHPQVMSGDFFF